jgi:hypothetical protein
LVASREIHGAFVVEIKDRPHRIVQANSSIVAKGKVRDDAQLERDYREEHPPGKFTYVLSALPPKSFAAFITS